MYTSAVARRQNESGENYVNVGLKLTRTTRDELEAIGIELDRPLGYIARKLVLKGLAAYKADHQLEVPKVFQDAGSSVSVPVLKAKLK